MDKSMPAVGWRVYGLGVIAIGLVALAWGGVDQGQPMPKGLPGATVLGYAAAAFTVIAGAAVEWRRTVAWASAALAVYFGIVVFLVMDGWVILHHYREYVAYSGSSERLAIAAGGLIVYAANAPIEPALAARLTRIGRVVFGVCAVLFGGAHFFYMNLTAPLVPTWLPPSQVFWGYATGVAQIAAGLAFITGVKARLAAILLTVMYVSFTVLIHIPLALADPSVQRTWTENTVNLVLIGVAWVVADSLARPKP